jgi:hypothetical protein
MMIREGRPFPAMYEARELDEIPVGAEVVELFPGTKGGSGGLIFLVDPLSSGSWVGLAHPGASRGHDTVSGLVATPNPKSLCVLVHGTAYVVDVTDRTYYLVPVSTAVTTIAPIPAAGVLLLGTPWFVIGVGQDGVLWRSGRLAIDGLRIDEADDLHLIGVADPESAEPREFVIDLRTGAHEGGAVVRP